MPTEKFIGELKETGIIDAIGGAISIQDTDLKILYQNQRHRDIFGDQGGNYCYKAYQDKDHICEGCHLSMSFRDGKIYTVEQSRATEKGIRYFENTASQLRDSIGRSIAGIEVLRDITERKKIEEVFKRARKELEIGVKERTAELETSFKLLQDEIAKHKQTEEKLLVEIEERKKIEENFRFTEKELITHLKELKESNTAFKVLLKQREKDKKEYENNILYNMKHLIFPYIAKLKKNRSMSEELVYLDKLESNLKEIVSPFSHKLSFNYLSFTPKEIQIADLIKDGKQDKDIIEILNISLDTIKTHRKNIRRKLGIYGKRINLRTKLLSFTE